MKHISELLSENFDQWFIGTDVGEGCRTIIIKTKLPVDQARKDDIELSATYYNGPKTVVRYEYGGNSEYTK